VHGRLNNPKTGSHYCQRAPAGSSALSRDYDCQLEAYGVRSETGYIIDLEDIRFKSDSWQTPSQRPAWEAGSSYSVSGFIVEHSYPGVQKGPALPSFFSDNNNSEAYSPTRER